MVLKDAYLKQFLLSLFVGEGKKEQNFLQTCEENGSLSKGILLFFLLLNGTQDTAFLYIILILRYVNIYMYIHICLVCIHIYACGWVAVLCL